MTGLMLPPLLTGTAPSPCTSTVITLTADIALSAGLELTPLHNGLTIQSASGNQYEISGDSNYRPIHIAGAASDE